MPRRPPGLPIGRADAAGPPPTAAATLGFVRKRIGLALAAVVAVFYLLVKRQERKAQAEAALWAEATK